MAQSLVVRTSCCKSSKFASLYESLNIELEYVSVLYIYERCRLKGASSSAKLTPVPFGANTPHSKFFPIK